MADNLSTDEELDQLQWTTVLYDLHETNPDSPARCATAPSCAVNTQGISLADDDSKAAP
jgi:hypothetical protein